MAAGSAPRTIHLRTLCFVRDRDRILLLRRHKPPNEGLYNAPGGKIEPDEDPYEACVRETLEETGFQLPAVTLRAVLTVITKTTGAQWVIFVFVADRPAGEPGPIATPEGDLRWVPLADIGALPVVSDIPLMLPRLFAPEGGVLLGKLLCETDDSDSIIGYEFRRA
jgi:8-oxo-dGTP diphosphatase